MMSIKNIAQTFVKTTKRFPLTVLSAVVLSVMGILLIHVNPLQDSDWPYKLLMASGLGLFLFTSASLFVENHKEKFYREMVYGGSIIFLVLYYFLLPSSLDESYTFIVRFILLAVAFLLAIPLAPFFANGKMNGFWQFSKTLFVRLFFTILFTGVLYLGLILSLLSLDELFGLYVNDDLYGSIWVAITGLISTNFFLAGFPKETAKLEKEKEYPKGIRVFSQYILLPLLGIYALILYAYAGKIAFTGEPKLDVAVMIIIFCLVAIFTYFLLYPSLEKQRWVKVISKVIFALIPLLVIMLFWALWLQISDYGITEWRYYGLILGVWLLVTAAYFLLSKKQNIKWLPASLAAIAVITSVGPWGAVDFSRWSQFNRLTTVLEANDLLVDGKIKGSDALVKLSDEDNQKFNGALDYLVEFHGYKSIQPFFGEPVEDSCEWRWDRECYASLMGVEYNYTYRFFDHEGGEYRSLYSPMEGLKDIEGYKLLLNFNANSHGEMHLPDFAKTDYTFLIEESELVIRYLEEEFARLDLVAIVEPFVEGSDRHEPLAYGAMSYEGDGFKLVLLNVDFRVKDEGEVESFEWVNGEVLLR